MRFDYGLPTVFISDYDLAVEAYSGDALMGRPTKLLPGYAVLRGKVQNTEILTFFAGTRHINYTLGVFGGNNRSHLLARPHVARGPEVHASTHQQFCDKGAKLNWVYQIGME